MIHLLIEVVVDESKWLTASLGFALMAISAQFYRHRHSDLSLRHRVFAAMNLFFGVTIGVMAFGHLLAVTTKLLRGTLVGSVPLLYLIGVALAVPSWWLIHHARAVLIRDNSHGRTTLALNSWLAVTLLAMGVHNLPLAAPGFLNIWYHFQSSRSIGWVIAALAVLVNVGLLVGSLIFMASGQSFEQFRGIR